MVRSVRVRTFALLFAGVLVLVLGGVAMRSSASGARFFAFGPTNDTCKRTGMVVPAGYQDSRFGIEAQGFWDSEPVFISITFPDGRVFSPQVTGPDTANTPLGLDGIIDMPPNFPWVFAASRGGDYAFNFDTTNKWPYGCYSLTAHGAASNRDASADFVITPHIGVAPNPGAASLLIQDNTTGDPSALHGALVDLFGRGFLSQEVISVWITAPDGVVISYPQQQASDIGAFASTFRFGEQLPVGRYAFTALGTRSGYQVIAYFQMDSRPSLQSGWAQLRVSSPYTAVGRQDYTFEIQGKRFDPYERVDIWITLPDNSVRSVPSQYANEFGEFFVNTFLDERLPTGTYDFTAKGATSGQLVITSFTLFPGSPNVTTDPPIYDPAPIITYSNSGDGTLGTVPQPPLPMLDPQPEPGF